MSGNLNRSGRKKGQLNRRTLESIALKEKLGFSPIEFLMLVAKGDWQALGYDKPTKLVEIAGVAVEVPLISLEHRIRAAESVAPYMAPKLTAVHVSTDSPDAEEAGPALVINFAKNQAIEAVASETSTAIEHKND